MIVVVGTVPYKTGLYVGQANVQDKTLLVGGTPLPVERGTAALAATCAQVCDYYGLERPLCILGGDVADGKGTDLMFREVIDRLDQYAPTVVTLHYMFPKIAQGEPVVNKILSLSRRPQLIADAGGMYLMKVIHKASLFDVFTPDEGELYFLADEMAPHPLYVRSEMLSKKLTIEDLVLRSYKESNTARTTVVKGATDRIYKDGQLLSTLNKPNIPAMEVIGGTGDTITGMLTALRFKGDDNADFKALELNRMIGRAVKCNPATQIEEFIKAIPDVLRAYDKTTT